MSSLDTKKSNARYKYIPYPNMPPVESVIHHYVDLIGTFVKLSKDEVNIGEL